MQLSQPKTKTMIFNPLRKYDLFPEISIKQGEFTEVVEEQKYWEILSDRTLKQYQILSIFVREPTGGCGFFEG